MLFLRRALITSLILCFVTPAVHAWDRHRDLTRRTLSGFQGREAALWAKLNRPVPITSVDHFIQRAFGDTCTFESLQDTGLEGLGRDYRLLFTSRPKIRYEIDWDRGTNRQIIIPPPSNSRNPHSPGNRLSPSEILAVYSDEPDWNMDDDVPRLRGKGVSPKSEGTATRVLRHFWYEGERILSYDFGKDQETDRRIRIFNDLALIAFALGEDYWGYRFLANALHYVQDLTQPYHVKARISSKMVNPLGVVRAGLCEFRGGIDCDPGLGQKLIESGWVVGAYHGLYEDLARGMLSPAGRFSTYMYVADRAGLAETYEVEKLPWPADGENPRLDGLAITRALQRHILPFASVGDLSFESFGWVYAQDLSVTRKVLDLVTTDRSPGFEIATLFRLFKIGLTPRQDRGVPRLVKQTHEVLKRAGVWGRQLVRHSLQAAADARHAETIQRLRHDYGVRCAAVLSR